MKCNIARDLLPLYFDGLCSDETRKQLEEHIENCESCKLLKQNLEEEPAVPFYRNYRFAYLRTDYQKGLQL